MTPSNGTNGRALWLCLYIPGLPLEIFTRGMAPGDLEQPVVILERQRVLFLNAAAEAAGIQIGNSMDTALSLSRCVNSIERDEAKEADALMSLARWSYQFTPVVCIQNENALALEISGCLALFGGLQNLRSRLLEGLIDLGYRCRIAHAPTPLAALLLARAEKDGDESADIRDSIADISVTLMESGPEIIESLSGMGIRRMGDLLALPRPELGRRFGREFIDYLDRLTGARADPREAIVPAPDFCGEIHFLHDVTDKQSLLFPMKRLLVELAGFLTSRQLAVERFVWELRHRNHGRERIAIRLAGPDNDRAMFLTVTQLQLERWSGMAEVDSLALIARRFSPARLATNELFRDRSYGQHDGVATGRDLRDEHKQLLNMLRARLGPETCFGISLANDHRPEHAWKRVRLDRGDYWSPPGEPEGNPRPLYLLQPAKPLVERDGKPHLQGPLTLLRGPERIDFGWWERNTPRDYYVARHPSGALYWVCKHLKDGKWYLHGIFA